MQHLQTQTKIYALQKDITEVIKDFTGSFNSQKTQGRYQTVLKQFFELLEVQKLEELSDIHIVGVKKTSVIERVASGAYAMLKERE